ncbi:hypothetical protein ACTFIU_003325 [Dictyostelium citrinum]
MRDPKVFPISEEDQYKVYHAVTELQCGELYRFLGVKKEDTIDKIAQTYKVIRSNFEDDKQTLENLDAAYAVISDKRLREFYDKELYLEMVKLELEYFQSLNQKNHSLLSMFAILAAPFEIASLVLYSSTSRENSLQILKSFIKRHSAFSLGKIVISQALVPSAVALTIQPLFIMKDKLIGSYSTMGKFTDEILWCLASFVVAFPFDCYILSANHQLSFIQVVKKVILCQDSITGKFNFKNLTHTFISVCGMYAVNTVLKGSVKKLEQYVESKSLENPNSTFWKNALIVKSLYAKTFLLSLLLVPYETIRCQYPHLYIQNYLGNTSILMTTNPISLTINLIKSQGFGKLYKAFPFSFVIFLLNEYLVYAVKKE